MVRFAEYDRVQQHIHDKFFVHCKPIEPHYMMLMNPPWVVKNAGKARRLYIDYARENDLIISIDIHCPWEHKNDRNQRFICQRCGSNELVHDYKNSDSVCVTCGAATYCLEDPGDIDTTSKYSRTLNFKKKLSAMIHQRNNLHIGGMDVERIMIAFKHINNTFWKMKINAAPGSRLSKRRSMMGLAFCLHKIAEQLGIIINVKLPKLLKTRQEAEMLWKEVFPEKQ